MWMKVSSFGPLLVVAVLACTNPQLAHAANASLAMVSQDRNALADKSALTQVKSLSQTQIAVLQRAGVRTVAQLATIDPAVLARHLQTRQATAAQIVEESKGVAARMAATYGLHSRTFVTRVSREDQYARLVEPTNECTLLVRKTCGAANQCATAPGCPVAMILLERFNEGGAAGQEAAESCLMSLEDGIVFAACGQR
jgi:hypothetical protein